MTARQSERLNQCKVLGLTVGTICKRFDRVEDGAADVVVIAALSIRDRLTRCQVIEYGIYTGRQIDEVHRIAGRLGYPSVVNPALECLSNLAVADLSTTTWL